MTIELSTSELAVACAFLGGQIAVLSGVVRSNIAQGKRLGMLEKAESARTAVLAYKEERRRKQTDTRGIAVSREESNE